ncbi:MAG: Crp/Fnr family transcriptional regulator [Deltaproteobacteria bacterium]|jgi:CRP-like cAMP-binding protein|nr:Crp/Fnr family transcriptional regulator [Deltaproteobacteria bacterium]
MKNILKNSRLFSGVSESEFDSLIKCLGASLRRYRKGESVCLAGGFVSEIGIVVGGKVHIVKGDAWGNQNIIAEIGAGEMFAEAFVCGGVGVLPVSVFAATDAEVMFADFQRVIAQCSNSCVFHRLLIRNIIGILARKNIMLQGKMEHITKRTTKEKLLSYLSEQSRLHGSREFDIPFDRQGLADYLSVERSALSAEMSKLKAAGVIGYRKSRFEILTSDELL